MADLAGGFEQTVIAACHVAQMKDIDLALLQVVAKSNAQFPGPRTKLAKVLAFIVKDPASLEELKEQDGVSCVLNPNFSGNTLADVEKPDSTAMIYEADHGELAFRYSGKALVGLANGSVRLVTRDESLKLYWLPHPLQG